MTEINDIMSRAEVAELLGISVRTLQRWERQDLAPPRITIHRQTYYLRPSIRQWLEDQQRTPLR